MAIMITKRAPLSDTLAGTLANLNREGESSAPALQGAYPDDVSVTAINNRLEDLRALGLVTRRRDGRRWIYRATAKGKR